jgi:hypothetical protein
MAGLVMLAGHVMAATTATVVLRITPTGTKSVTLDVATVDFGSVPLASSNTVANLSPSSVTVTNNGQIVETFGLRISVADPNWTDAAGTVNTLTLMDQYNLRALFNGATQPAPGAFGGAVATHDVRTGAAVLATGTVFAGTQTGLNVPPSGTNTRGLWFRWDMPGYSSVATQRQVTVEVSAN